MQGSVGMLVRVIGRTRVELEIKSASVVSWQSVGQHRYEHRVQMV